MCNIRVYVFYELVGKYVNAQMRKFGWNFL